MFGRRAYMLGAICWWSYMLGYYICWVTWPNIYPTYIWVNTYVVYICWVTWGFVDETPFPEHCFRYNPVIITFLPRVIPFFVLSHHQILNCRSIFIFSDTRITPNNFKEPLSASDHDQTWQIGIFGIILIPIVVQYTLFSYLVTPIFIPEILIFISVILKFIHGSRCWSMRFWTIVRVRVKSMKKVIKMYYVVTIQHYTGIIKCTWDVGNVIKLISIISIIFDDFFHK